MDNDIKFTLDADTVDKLAAFGELLDKDVSTMINEALQLYFETAEEKLAEKDAAERDAMTNLSFDEFWDGVDL